MKKISRFLGMGAVLFVLISLSCGLPTVSPGGETGTGPGAAPEAPSNTDGAETILIPGATFWMGSETTDPQADEDEFPRHQVTVSGFHIYTHEVTNEMYAECVAAGACMPVMNLDSGPTSHTSDPAYADHPVVGVDYAMARGYCSWANARLPTEAEWELAARGAESLRFPWGAEDPGCERVNMFGCYVPPMTVPVGSFAPGNSPYGLWDMGGNVWEWVRDWYDDDYYVLSPSVDPPGPYVGELKVVRGGGLYSEPDQMRAAARQAVDPARAFDDIGFRCVALQEGSLDGYVDAPERHERVPPDDPDGGGERAEDPDPDPGWWVGVADAAFTCPDTEGRIHLIAEVTASVDPTTWSVSVGSVPFACTLDPVLDILDCAGLPPADYDPWAGEAAFELCWEHALGSGCWDMIGSTPGDCGARMTPFRMAIDLDCPVDGWLTATFTFDPVTRWDMVRLSGIDVACWPTLPNEMRCIIPDVREGDRYNFLLQGIVDTGEEVRWSGLIPVRDDCPPDRLMFLTADSTCFEGHPVAQVMYDLGWPPLDHVEVEGAGELFCVGMAPGVQLCGDLPGAPGDDADVQVCFEDAGCHSFVVSVPDCSIADIAVGFVLEPYCYPPDAPAASIHIWPWTDPIISAEAGGVPVSCADWGGGWYVCPGIPGAPGDAVPFVFCLAGGDCYRDGVFVADCTGTGPGGDDGWRMAAVGCHDDLHTYFMIDTGLPWLVPGADLLISADDGATTYTCAIHPTVPGRVYCAGVRPAAPGPLQFCLQRTGEAVPTCMTYPDYPVWVAGIPPCDTAEPPPEPVPVVTCADYTDMVTCQTNGCIWTKGPPDGLEHCYPPP